MRNPIITFRERWRREAMKRRNQARKMSPPNRPNEEENLMINVPNPKCCNRAGYLCEKCRQAQRDQIYDRYRYEPEPVDNEEQEILDLPSARERYAPAPVVNADDTVTANVQADGLPILFADRQ